MQLGTVVDHLMPQLSQLFLQHQKNFFRRKETSCMIRSKVKVTEVRKLQKWPISKSVSSTDMHVIKTLTVNYHTPRQYLNFTRTDFLIFVPVLHHMTYKLRVFLFWQTNFAFYEESSDSLVSGLFILTKYLPPAIDCTCGCAAHLAIAGVLVCRDAVYLCWMTVGWVIWWWLVDQPTWYWICSHWWWMPTFQTLLWSRTKLSRRYSVSYTLFAMFKHLNITSFEYSWKSTFSYVLV